MDRAEQKHNGGLPCAWLQLFRLPNLFTVPGDPVAGLLLASPMVAVPPRAFVAVAGAVLMFYMSGLALNDYFDLDTDRRQRPGRPLPSGRIRSLHALAAAAALMAAGLLICFSLGGKTLWIGIGLAAAVVAYNRALKHMRVMGAINMGACRGLSVLLGASVVSINTPAILAAGVVAVYITVVTCLARRETETQRADLIGQLISALLFIQAACALVAGSPVAAAVLALCWPVNRALARRFYAS